VSRRAVDSRWVVSFLLVAFASRYALSESTAAPRKIVTQPQIQLVLTAIEDEIYTHNLEKAYVDLGPDKISICVKPHFENGMIWVIYKLLPFGELMRGAVINEGRGVAILSGDPDVGFPPTNGSAMPTLYLDDDAVR